MLCVRMSVRPSVRPCPTCDRISRNLIQTLYHWKEWQKEDYQNSIELDAETKESTRKTEEKLDGRYKGGHERKKPK